MAGGVHGHAVAGASGESIDTVHDDLTEANTSLDGVNTKLDAANIKLQAIADNTDTLEVNVAAVNVNTDTLETLIASTNSKTDTGNASLSSVDGKLTNQATAAKQDTGNTSLASIDSKMDLRATAAKQDTQTTALNLLHTDNGNEGSAPPTLNGAGAAGILGYLRNTVDKLNTVVSQMTSGAQQTKITDGTNIASLVVADQNAVVTLGATKSTSGSFAGTQTLTLDLGAYSWVSLQSLSSVSASISLSWSVDNVTFVAVTGGLVNLTNIAASTTNIGTGTNGTFATPVWARYLKLTSAGTSVSYALQAHTGNWPLSLVQTAAQTASALPVSAAQSGTWTVAQGSQGTLPWLVGGSIATLSNITNSSVIAGATANFGCGLCNWGMSIIIAGTGSLSALTVILEGSNDAGTNWTTIQTYTGTTTGYVSSTAVMPFQYVRSRISVYTVTSGTPTVTTRIVGTV
jgi:hypothetical protein